MSKQYGLIIPGQQKKPAAPPPSREKSKPSIFDESSDSDGDAPPPLKLKTAPIAISSMERRLARRQQEKALAEDPTIFQYDEHYDELEAKREDEKQAKSKEPKKAKYIGRLLQHAERRKLENERRVERQVQLEREQEGEEFKDKESFVTTAYRNKIEELRVLEQQEIRDDYLEAIGDVTKQNNLDGFYRHLYEQKTSSSKEVKKPELPTVGENEKEPAYEPIKSVKTQQRAYRKRHSSAEAEADEMETDAQKATKKVHLPNNIDADSDFSIDSSSSDDEDDKVEKNDAGVGKRMDNVKKAEKKNISDSEKTESDKKLDKIKTEDSENEVKTAELESLPPPPPPPPPPKKDKSEIWKKRTVGTVFDDAVKRYYERKAARNA